MKKSAFIAVVSPLGGLARGRCCNRVRHNGIKCSQQPQLLSVKIVVLKRSVSQQEEEESGPDPRAPEVLSLIRRASGPMLEPYPLLEPSAALLAPRAMSADHSLPSSQPAHST